MNRQSVPGSVPRVVSWPNESKSLLGPGEVLPEGVSELVGTLQSELDQY